MQNFEELVINLLDENYTDPIVIYDENDNEVKFEPIAVIPEGEKLYTILRPLNEEDDIYFVFFIDFKEELLVFVDDDKIIDKVFENYNELVKANNVDADDL